MYGYVGGHALVTGGTRGIGRAVVEAFLREGIHVSYCARKVTGNEFEAFIKQLPWPVMQESTHTTAASEPQQQQREQTQHIPRAKGTIVDVSDLEALRKWVDDAAGEFGGITYVVANASPLLLSSTIPDWEASFQSDILGLVHLLSTCTPHLTQQSQTHHHRHRSICVISSGAGNEIHAPIGPYGPMKLAQIHHAKALSHSLAPQGIRVNSVSPRLILTKGGHVEGLMEREKREGVKGAWEEVRKGIPLGRAGSVEDVAAVVMFLCSPVAGFVTGVNVRVDGGLSRGM